MIFGVEQGLAALAARLRTARRVTVMTGAGVSAASGVPTFRGPGGLSANLPPGGSRHARRVRARPGARLGMYAWRRELVASCAPNAAHEVLARWSQRDGVRVVTQNVDDLHVRAGTRDLVRLHGSLWELKCFDWLQPWRGAVARRTRPAPGRAAALPSLRRPRAAGGRLVRRIARPR